MDEFGASLLAGEALNYLKRKGYSIKSITTSFRKNGVLLDVEFQESVKDEDRKIVD